MSIDSRRQLLKSEEHFVYIVNRPIWTGDFRYYVGVSKHPQRRWQEHKRNAPTRLYFLHKWMNQHPDCAMTVVHGPCSKEEAYQFERDWVSDDNQFRQSIGLINEAGGGVCGAYRSGKEHWTHKVAKKDLPLTGVVGKFHPAFGRRNTVEQIAKRSGSNHPNFGNKGANCKTSKAVKATNILTGEVVCFPSALAAFQAGIAKSHGNVINCCKNRDGYSQHNGYKWEYAT
jgi:predicted GIY-YIG superfamily endonuclease